MHHTVRDYRRFVLASIVGAMGALIATITSCPGSYLTEQLKEGVDFVLTDRKLVRSVCRSDTDVSVRV